MATFDSSDWDAFGLTMEEIANLPRDLLDEMLMAECEVLAEGQAQKAREMLQGPYYAGAVAGAVHINQPKASSDGVETDITFVGSQHGNRLGEIAYINEYGKHGQPARPFILTSNEEKLDSAINAAAAIYDKYLAEHGL